jgi:hypothetical protein
VVSVHTPEFESHKKRTVVERSAQEYGLRQPIYMDNDYAFWKALGNEYWPSFYLVDKRGRIRTSSIGEMHAGTGRTERFEALMRQLLAEPGA